MPRMVINEKHQQRIVNKHDREWMHGVRLQADVSELAGDRSNARRQRIQARGDRPGRQSPIRARQSLQRLVITLFAFFYMNHVKTF
jgi:hypothetical protein